MDVTRGMKGHGFNEQILISVNTRFDKMLLNSKPHNITVSYSRYSHKNTVCAVGDSNISHFCLIV